MDSLTSVVEGEAFPLGSKRLTVRHMQQLASGLGLPTAATKGDLEVMINGKLVDMFHDPKCVQVIVSVTEQGEELSLRDMDGIFLVIPPLSRMVSKSPTSSEGNWSEEDMDLSIELTQLRHLLQGLEEGNVALKVELESTKDEVARLKADFSKANEHVLELWQENCKQLIEYDNAVTERDREMRLVREQLQMRELELARLKLSNLGKTELSSEVTKLNIKSTESSGAFREGYQERPDISCSHLPILRASTLSDHTRGHVFVPTRPTTTTADFSPLEHLSKTTSPDILPLQGVITTSNPFQGDRDQLLSTMTSTTQPLMTSHIPPIDQRHSGRANVPIKCQSSQQVTNLSTSLSDVLYVSRPISSTGIASGSKLTTESQACAPRQGKAPPVDPFTA